MDVLKIIVLLLLKLTGVGVIGMVFTFTFALVMRTWNRLPDPRTAYLMCVFVLWIIGPATYFILLNYEMELWVKLIIVYLVVCFLCYSLVPILYKLYKKSNSNNNSKPILKAGARRERYNYALFSKVYFVVAAILLVIGVWLFYTRNEGVVKYMAFHLSFVFVGLGLMLRRLPDIYKKQLEGIEEIKYASFALFLRGFNYEKGSFYFGPYLPEFGKTNEQLKASYISGSMTVTSFETFFSYQIKVHIGEFVGLGNPEEIDPHESIKMIYTLDDWRKQFFSLAQAATCIVVQPCLTESLRYELTELLKAGFAHKLYFFTKPSCGNFVLKYYMWLSELAFHRKPPKWFQFEKMLHQIGFTSNIQVQKGAVVGFNENNETVLLQENCKRPSEYIKMVKADLNNKGLLN